MDELAKEFAALAAQYAPSVIDAAKRAATVEAYSTLAGALLWFFVSGASIAAALSCHEKVAGEADSGWWFGVIIFGVVGLLCALPGVWAFVDPWTWTAMNHPELWIAKKALHL